MIKYLKYTAIFMLIIIFFASPETFAQGIKKEMGIGYVRWKITDTADEGEGSWGWGENRAWYEGFIGIGTNSSKAVMMASKDWTDEDGTQWNIKVSGHGQWETDDRLGVFPIADAEGWTIHRYYRYPLPAITVDGTYLSDPFPLNFSDHVDPDRLPGTADGLIESFIRTDMGVSLHQRVIGFSQQNHDKYIIREYIFTNTGNTDQDDDIELPGQNIEAFYFLKQLRPQEFPQKPWCSAIGQFPGDPIRMCYAYSQRNQGTVEDDFGGSNTAGEYEAEWRGKLVQPFFWGEQVIFASAAPNDFTNDDVNQPRTTSFLDVDFDGFTFHGRNMTDTQRERLYQVMEEGAVNMEDIFWPELTGTKPGHHGIPLDQRGFKNVEEMEGYGYSASVAFSIGPYDLAFGDSIKFVIAEVFGSISPKKGYEVGIAWETNQATWGDMVIGGSTDILPPQYQANPDLIQSTDGRSELNNWAKDNWVYSGFDSLMETAKAAKWAYENNYNVPVPPRAPDVTVLSLPDNVRITWGTKAEEGDFAGYRVYRAVGSYYPHVDENSTNLVGDWQMIFQCGEGTANELTREYEDKTAQRGFAYHYAVTAFDNGAENGPDYNGLTQSLETAVWHNYTPQAGFLVKPGGTLDDVVVVPNPFNLSAGNKNFPGEENKIMFFNVPSKCTIRIFTESGDLVKEIEHEGSGDSPWGDIPQEHSATDIGQIVVSGIYIAHIETDDGKSTVRKFVVVR